MNPLQPGRIFLLSFLVLMFMSRKGVCNRNLRHSHILNGSHLIIASLQSSSGIIAKRNATGHVTSATGIPVFMLEWLSKEYKFTFSYLSTNVNAIEGTRPGQRGLIDYIIEGQTDIILPLVPTDTRIALIDFLHPYLEVPVSYLIPFGNENANTSAVTNPFQISVWVVTALAVAIVTSVFYLINFMLRNNQACVLSTNLSGSSENSIMNVPHNYVLGVLLNQGGFCTSTKLSIRIMAGCWCLACVVLVNSYSSVLISYLTLSKPILLISSIEELRERSDIFLVTDKGLSTDVILSTSGSGLLKALGDKLRAYPKSRCDTRQQCLALVKAGSHVYTSGIETYLTKGMREDYILTNKCNFHLGKNSYMNMKLSWGITKDNLCTQDINHGLMRMREFGLMATWKRRYEADVSRCIYKANQYSKEERLALIRMTAAFAILIAGTLLSCLTFFCEKRGLFLRNKN